MKFHFALIIALLLVISGCAKTGPSCASPSIPLENGCCLDINRNGVCDRAEGDIVAEESAVAEETAEEAHVSGTPVIGTSGEETRDTSKWESIKLYYHDTLERCGKKITFSFDEISPDSIFLKTGTAIETIAKGDIGLVIESKELDYVVQDFGIFTGADEGRSWVLLKLHCR